MLDSVRVRLTLWYSIVLALATDTKIKDIKP
jgi:hypothetical protein